VAFPVQSLQPSIDRGLVALDERLANAKGGVVLTRVHADARHAVVRHIARRLAPIMRVAETSASSDSLVRNLLANLGETLSTFSVSEAADQLARIAAHRPLALVSPIARSGSWDAAVFSHLLEGAPKNVLFAFVGDESATLSDAEVFDLSSTLTDLEKAHWLDAITHDAHSATPGSDWIALEKWWALARNLHPTHTEKLSDEAATLAEHLALAGRAWPLANLITLASRENIAQELVTKGAAEIVKGSIALIGHSRLSPPRSEESVKIVANALLASFNDPWAHVRAASLLASSGNIEEADARINDVLGSTLDSAIRGELVAEWFHALSTVRTEHRSTLMTRAAERALHAGEPGEANDWLKEAARHGASGAHADLLSGRIATALGDLVAAEVSLLRCKEAADGELALECAIELGEVYYLSGRPDLATAEAKHVLESGSPSLRLRARNILGKILLLESKWEEADRHFAADALEARSLGDQRADLRAQLNRGIALLSRRRLDEARSIFEAVLTESEAIGEPMAAIYALPNLGVVAMQQRAYSDALRFFERSLEIHRRSGIRAFVARSAANLAELRVKLGLFDHAEHAIAFGRRSLGNAATSALANHFNESAARVALAKGNTELARREILNAISEGEAAADRGGQSASYRVLARIALEEGDVDLANRSVSRARELGATQIGEAEIALLEALVARAMGREDGRALALAALASARSASESSDADDTLLEAHALVATMHLESGDREPARAHIQKAIALHEAVASQLTNEIRAAFIARPESVALFRLQSQLASRSDSPSPDSSAMEAAPPTMRSTKKSFDRQLVGDDPQIQSLVASIRKVARANATVLVRGESGTGKELVAEAIHAASDRANGPLVTVNCAALVETLLLSELFGHEKGAFTGASGRKKGRFEVAEGGTLFLDEIGDISPRTQVALLRVLQERTFERVGGTTPVKTDARIICATHRDLKAMVERGEFREDLYYRLRQLTLEVPALRSRIGDLPKIAASLLARIASERDESPKTLSADAIELLCRHRWPGNVRELENVLRAAALFADSKSITAADLVENIDEMRAVASQASAPRVSALPPPPSTVSLLPVPTEAENDDLPLPTNEAEATAVAYAQVRQGTVSLSDLKRQIERDCIARALEETGGNITRAALLLGMKRPRLSQLVKQYGLSASSEGA